MSYRARGCERLAAGLAGRGVDALLVTDLTNVRYLTGYTGSNGAVVARPGGSVFLTDFRYLERVAPLREFIEVRQANQDLIRLRRQPLGRAGAAAQPGSASRRRTCRSRRHALLAEAAGDVELVATTGAVEGLRMVKDDDEIEADPPRGGDARAGLRAAGRARAWPAAPSSTWPGAIQELVREHGGDGIAFDSIVASGAAGALPHAEPRRRCRSRRGTLVTIDLGAHARRLLLRLHAHVRHRRRPRPRWARSTSWCCEAQLAGLDAVRPGRRRQRRRRGRARHHRPRPGTASTSSTAPATASGSRSTRIRASRPPPPQPSSRAWSSQWSRASTCPASAGCGSRIWWSSPADGCERLTGYPKELITAG